MESAGGPVASTVGIVRPVSVMSPLKGEVVSSVGVVAPVSVVELSVE